MYLNETINWCCFKEILKSSEVHKDWFTVWTVKDVCTGFLNTYVVLNYQNDKDFYFLMGIFYKRFHTELQFLLSRR